MKESAKAKLIFKDFMIKYGKTSYNTLSNKPPVEVKAKPEELSII